MRSAATLIANCRKASVGKRAAQRSSDGQGLGRTDVGDHVDGGRADVHLVLRIQDPGQKAGGHRRGKLPRQIASQQPDVSVRILEQFRHHRGESLGNRLQGIQAPLRRAASSERM